ncbi:MAG: alpha/beta hydrolase [Porticoccaceae bacterium]|jgi:alpha-beta hydrolase superfamily lysophospholipase|nr:alpha/beta hydrolase [Porticoccaceae bacterium]MBT4590621.1 alpha/beta hydrolase [Porticoccaceae bacterium]MBT5104394.1 alpha/beta hydrolase [Porticoccaceae bacterium]MBT6026850.1 alpha/beta hydrolase [Porticoccaceae bacterium]MBT6423114.1 alpha/beta hydrolase [Porticoccaceae bacterium]
MQQRTTFQAKVHHKLLLCMLFVLSTSCVASIDTVVLSLDDQLILEQGSPTRHTVVSDDHPMAVWEKSHDDAKGIILFIHGRTWSGLPDFDLQMEGEELSLMDGMLEQGYGSYAIDLRGYGKTPRDASQWLSPTKAAADVVNVIRWISERHQDTPIHVFGWSYGSVISLLATQTDSSAIASLTLFGFWLDLDGKVNKDSKDKSLEKRINTAEAAASDFIVPGSISQRAINGYVKAALAADPVRVDWRNEHEFLGIDPSRIDIPVLLIQGEFDPIAPTDLQAKLFTRLKSADKSWVVVSGGDHAAFMEMPRPYFISAFSDFIDRFNP